MPANIIKKPKILIDIVVGRAIRTEPTIKRDRDTHRSLADLVLLKFLAVSIVMTNFRLPLHKVDQYWLT